MQQIIDASPSQTLIWDLYTCYIIRICYVTLLVKYTPLRNEIHYPSVQVYQHNTSTHGRPTENAIQSLSQKCHQRWAAWSDEQFYRTNVPRYWPFVGEIHRSPVSSSHKGQWRGDNKWGKWVLPRIFLEIWSGCLVMTELIYLHVVVRHVLPTCYASLSGYVSDKICQHAM